MKNQLFKIIPDKKITLKLLSFFGINNLEDNHSFSKDFLIEFNTIDKINNIIKELENYYLPCKYKIYLRNLNEKMCLLILRRTKFTIIHSQKKNIKMERNYYFIKLFENKLNRKNNKKMKNYFII